MNPDDMNSFPWHQGQILNVPHLPLDEAYAFFPVRTCTCHDFIWGELDTTLDRMGTGYDCPISRNWISYK